MSSTFFNKSGEYERGNKLQLEEKADLGVQGILQLFSSESLSNDPAMFRPGEGTAGVSIDS